VDSGGDAVQDRRRSGTTGRTKAGPAASERADAVERVVKKDWLIVLSCNDWEYETHVIVHAYKVVRVDDRTIKADKIKITFDEEFLDPQLKSAAPEGRQRSAF
jgi:hypothetical protein